MTSLFGAVRGHVGLWGGAWGRRIVGRFAVTSRCGAAWGDSLGCWHWVGQVMSSYRSRQSGLVDSIRASLRVREPDLICFSRAMAVVMSAYSSKWTNWAH